MVKRVREILFDAYARLSCAFSGLSAEGASLLKVYQEVLMKQQLTNCLEPTKEIMLKVTFWFRQILDYQIQAFSLWLYLGLRENADPRNAYVLKRSVFEFENVIKGQLAFNETYIDPELIYGTQAYINLQIEEENTARLAIEKFNQLVN